MKKGLKEEISELECRVMEMSPLKGNGGDWRKELNDYAGNIRMETGTWTSTGTQWHTLLKIISKLHNPLLICH